MKKVAIYGTGKAAQYFAEHHEFSGEELQYYVETKKKKESFQNHNVIGIREIDLSLDVVYVVNSYVDTVFEALNKGVSKNKIVLCNEPLCDEYIMRNNGILDIRYDKQFADEYEKYVDQTENRPNYVLIRTMNNPIDIFRCENVQNILDRRVILSDDYCRYGVLRLLIDEIISGKIEGEIAELGVYQGEFAQFLNKMFPNRKLYLFDTFEGFNNDDVDKELNYNFTSKDWFDRWDNFKNTNLELVMGKMTYPEQCVIRKGYFPNTIPDEELEFAFVSLDCDLYEPILAGLRYFYPRLKKGGYIMIHDYNQTAYLKGVKQAVIDFESEVGEIIPKVPITDICGSLVLCK